MELETAIKMLARNIEYRDYESINLKNALNEHLFRLVKGNNDITTES